MSKKRDLIEATIERVTEGWSDLQKQALMQRLHREAVRQKVAADFPSVSRLMVHLNPEYRITDALRKIDEGIEWALSTPDARLLITMPPQEGKSTACAVHAPIRALQLEPDWRIQIISYAESLAAEHSRAARNLIAGNGSDARDPLTGIPLPDKLGLSLSDDKSAASHWTIKGHDGGVYAVGLEGGLSGRRADLLIVDDPLKDMTAADSVTERKKVISWWEAVAQTRLAPGAPVIIIQTRWHEDDLAGHLLAKDHALPEHERSWKHINIPAIAEEGVPDALGREPGVVMESSRDYTDKDGNLVRRDFRRIKRDVGPRVWAALYQGVPTPTGGGLFSQSNFDRYRVPQIVGQVAHRIVSVDPAEKGTRDEAGIVGGVVTTQGQYFWTDDWSGRMTSDQWARRAVILALTTGAEELMFEAYTTETTYKRVIQQAWLDVHRHAKLLASVGADPALAAAALAAEPSSPANPQELINDVVGLRVPVSPTLPFRVQPHRGKGDKVARATGARQATSIGRLRIVGTLPVLESQASSWQQGQSSPDRMDAAVNLYERLVQLQGDQSHIASPTTISTAGAAQSIAARLSAPL